MTTAIAAYGTQLKMHDGGSPGTYATISEVKDISGPGYTRDTIDVTSHSSPDGWEEVLASFKRSGELTYDLNYNPDDPTHNIDTGVFSVLDSVDGKRSFQLVWPDDHGLQFDALVTGFEPASPVTDARTASVTLKPTGAPTIITP